MLYVLGLLLSAVASGFLIWGVRNFARRDGLAKSPDSCRHIHHSPVPRLGGLAIFSSFLIVFLFYLAVADRGWMIGPINGNIARILMLATGVFLTGLVDDRIGVRPLFKLAVEIAAGLGLYFSDIRFNFCPTHVAGSYTHL